jgi:hypothetical protein
LPEVQASVVDGSTIPATRANRGQRADAGVMAS